MEGLNVNMPTLKITGLELVWNVRCRLRAEGKTLSAEGSKLLAEADKLREEGEIRKATSGLSAEQSKLSAESYKLFAEADRLWAEVSIRRAEGDKLWTQAILEAYGDIKLEWKNFSDEKLDYECHLQTGEVFRP
jgi:hypothetical protein